MEQATQKPLAVALVSMPWAIFNRPSIQLGTLSGYLQREEGVEVDCFHLYLHVAKAITIDAYNRISLSPWAGEALFAPLLFAEKAADAEKLFASCFPRRRERPDFASLLPLIRRSCETWLEAAALERYQLLGISVCFSQLLPSLYLATLIKGRYPQLPIVFGGSSCAGAIGTALLEQFSVIDYLIDGEGERPLLQLCRYLGGQVQDPGPGVRHRSNGGREAGCGPPLDINSLPIPDYSDYSREVRTLFPAHPFVPVLPLEFSRGCWWNRCTFCNLNLQWQNYRRKTSERMVEETLHLARSCESPLFTFADNALPPREADAFFARMSEADIDVDFFAEIRATGNRDRLAMYRRGGLTTVQVGIEALSQSLLEKMAKGMTPMEAIT